MGTLLAKWAFNKTEKKKKSDQCYLTRENTKKAVVFPFGKSVGNLQHL